MELLYIRLGSYFSYPNSESYEDIWVDNSEHLTNIGNRRYRVKIHAGRDR